MTENERMLAILQAHGLDAESAARERILNEKAMKVVKVIRVIIFTSKALFIIGLVAAIVKILTM
jgi:hypothetical protein